MALSDDELATLQQIYRAKGDVFELAMTRSMINRGIDAEDAKNAARACANTMWRNSVVAGSATSVVLGLLYTPIVGAFAGGSMTILAAGATYMFSEACVPANDLSLKSAVDRLNTGLP